MTEKYPDGKTYRKLYQRFYNGRMAGELLELVSGGVRGKAVLDLCGGDGRLSLEAVRLGAERVFLVDREKTMISREAGRCPRIGIRIGSVEYWLENFSGLGLRFDCVACQQAVNYWLNGETARLVAEILKKGGTFVFNTFNRKTPRKPLVKEYRIGKDNFAEISWLAGKVVHHVQVREGMAPHVTSFYWLSPKRLEAILRPYFKVTVRKQGRTSLYSCVKI